MSDEQPPHQRRELCMVEMPLGVALRNEACTVWQVLGRMKQEILAVATCHAKILGLDLDHTRRLLFPGLSGQRSKEEPTFLGKDNWTCAKYASA
eukprot:352421-Chlamydomonas_euryale.AAC.20